jgi:hypothetical protein
MICLSISYAIQMLAAKIAETLAPDAAGLGLASASTAELWARSTQITMAQDRLCLSGCRLT